MIRVSHLSVGLSVVLLAACASGIRAPGGAHTTPAADPVAAATGSRANNERVDADYPVRPFPTQTLSALLAAELAGVRGEIHFALAQYREQSRITGDPGVIARAAHIAQYAGDELAMAELAELWIAREPDNPRAQELAMASLLQAGRVQEALPRALLLLQQGDAQAFRQLTAMAAKQSPEQRREVLTTLDEELRADPDNADLLFGTALLLWEEQRLTEALERAEHALRIRPETPSGHLLYAELLNAAGQRQQALDHLEAQLLLDVDHYNFSRVYVSLLLAGRNPAQAVARLRPLVERQPDDVVLRLGLALAYRETHQPDAAKAELSLLIDDPEIGDDARFYLASLFEAEGNVSEAIALYRGVEENYWLSATARLSQLLVEQGDLAEVRRHLAASRSLRQDQRIPLYQLEAELLMRAEAYGDARDLLTQGLATDPDSIELLYARSLAHEKLGDIAAVEADLRAILAADGENASALNALGYALTNHTDRLDEAQALIEQALALEPEDAAIIDSFGWVLFRRGEQERALVELQRAAAMLPDPEVIAHLGEVLWTMGEHEEARSVWAEGLRQFPNDSLIRETMQRLRVDP